MTTDTISTSTDTRRIVGWADLIWLTLVVFGACWVLNALLGHVHREVEVYKFGHEIVELDVERSRLIEEQHRLQAELEYRRNAVDTAHYASTVLGMAPVQPSQVHRVVLP
jgi:hypothetical protein